MHPEAILAQPLAFIRVLFKAGTMGGCVYQAVEWRDVLANSAVRCGHVYARRRGVLCLQMPVRYEKGDGGYKRSARWWWWRRPLGDVRVGSVPQNGRGSGRKVPGRNREDVFIVGWLHRHQVPLFSSSETARDAPSIEAEAVRRVWRGHVIVDRFSVIHLVSGAEMTGP